MPSKELPVLGANDKNEIFKKPKYDFLVSFFTYFIQI